MKHVTAFLSRLPVTFTVQAFVYPILLFAALIFAQLDKSPLSHTIFAFVLALPIVTALYLISARLCIRTALKVSEKTPEKKRFIKISAVISSLCPFPFPFVEAIVNVPDEKGFHFCDVKYTLSLLPFSKTLISHSAAFAFRGEYEVRLSHIYVYDPSHSVRLRINFDKSEKLFVMPRKLALPPYTNGESGTESANVGNEYKNGTLAEPADTRPYIVGDSPKAIHWKLSSKSEDIIVREYAGDDFAGVNIICDLEARFLKRLTTPDRHLTAEAKDVADLMLCDSAIECTLAAVSAELERKNTVFLSWISGGAPITVRIENEHDLGLIFRRFAAEMPSDAKDHAHLICTSPSFTSTLPTVVVTPYIDEKSAELYKSVFIKKGSQARAQILYCTPKGLFIPDESAERREEDIIVSLKKSGIDTVKISV